MKLIKLFNHLHAIPGLYDFLRWKKYNNGIDTIHTILKRHENLKKDVKPS